MYHCHGNFGLLKILVPDQFYLIKKVRALIIRSGRYSILFNTSTWLNLTLKVVDDGSDNFVEEIYAYLVYKMCPECVNERKKRVIRQKAAKLTISSEGELLFKHKQGKGKVNGHLDF